VKEKKTCPSAGGGNWWFKEDIAAGHPKRTTNLETCSVPLNHSLLSRLFCRHSTRSCRRRTQVLAVSLSSACRRPRALACFDNISSPQDRPSIRATPPLPRSVLHPNSALCNAICESRHNLPLPVLVRLSPAWAPACSISAPPRVWRALHQVLTSSVLLPSRDLAPITLILFHYLAFHSTDV
jgi:hypothetical protein